jgi:hypothetical protein
MTGVSGDNMGEPRSELDATDDALTAEAGATLACKCD